MEHGVAAGAESGLLLVGAHACAWPGPVTSAGCSHGRACRQGASEGRTKGGEPGPHASTPVRSCACVCPSVCLFLCVSFTSPPHLLTSLSLHPSLTS